MNILHLKYAVEIEKVKYLSKAAENLYIAQPNLSRALKELEDDLGITIFKRTPKGMIVTPDGEEFLVRAKKILRQIDDMDAIYQKGKKAKQSFAVSGPRSSYIADAFSSFADKIPHDRPTDLFYKETNTMRVINNLTQSDYKLGIIRYASNFERYFEEMLREKNLRSELVTEFRYCLVMSEKHPLASAENITFDDLSEFTEIAHADPYVPSLSAAIVRKEELPDNTDRRIFVFERASQYDLLENTEGTFMWVSPMPQRLLQKYGLVQRVLDSNKKVYKDVLVYKNDYKLSELDKLFISELHASKRNYEGLLY